MKKLFLILTIWFVIPAYTFAQTEIEVETSYVLKMEKYSGYSYETKCVDTGVNAIPNYNTDFYKKTLIVDLILHKFDSEVEERVNIHNILIYYNNEISNCENSRQKRRFEEFVDTSFSSVKSAFESKDKVFQDTKTMQCYKKSLLIQRSTITSASDPVTGIRAREVKIYKIPAECPPIVLHP